jgi:uncharacterized protein YebE (UPF0316 family)
MDAILAGFPWLPLLVFVAELCVVTCGTLRIIFVSRGSKALAAVLGFFEVVLWLFAIGQIMRNLTDWGCFLGFAAGFVCGNYLGILIDNALAIGTQVVRIITSQDATPLIANLKAAGYGVTSLQAEGGNGQVNLVFTVIKRKDLKSVVKLIEQFDPRTFWSVEAVQHAAEGVFPPRPRLLDTLPLPSTWRDRSRAA